MLTELKNLLVREIPWTQIKDALWAGLWMIRLSESDPLVQDDWRQHRGQRLIAPQRIQQPLMQRDTLAEQIRLYRCNL